MLEGRGAVLDAARAASRVLAESGIAGGVIGGVAVMLHGHVRATSDVDIYVPEPLAAFAERLTAAGFEFRPTERQFAYHGVPVQLVSAAHASPVPTHFVTLEDVRTVSLADLINLKLRSGTRSPLRARDLGDVVDLIRANGLDGRFTPRVAKPLRDEFRRLARMVRDDENRSRNDDPYDHIG